MLEKKIISNLEFPNQLKLTIICGDGITRFSISNNFYTMFTFSGG